MNATIERGTMLAERLEIKLIGTEGHDLKCACVCCESSDAGRIHSETGVTTAIPAQSLSVWDLCKVVTGDHEIAKQVMIEVGYFEPSHTNGHTNGHTKAKSAAAVFDAVCQRSEFRRRRGKHTPRLPIPAGCECQCFARTRVQCSSILITPYNGKGLNEANKNVGLYIPGRLPLPGETCLIVEGPKMPPHFTHWVTSPWGCRQTGFRKVCRRVPRCQRGHSHGRRQTRQRRRTNHHRLVIGHSRFRQGGIMSRRDGCPRRNRQGRHGGNRTCNCARRQKATSFRRSSMITTSARKIYHCRRSWWRDALHQASKLQFGGASKGYTTWTLDYLAIAVANGLKWLGLETSRSKVLLLDMELQPAFCRRRLLTLQDGASGFIPNAAGSMFGTCAALPPGIDKSSRVSSTALPATAMAWWFWTRFTNSTATAPTKTRARRCRLTQFNRGADRPNCARPLPTDRTSPRVISPAKMQSTG